MFYSGNSELQIRAFREKNPTYYRHDPIFNAYTYDHPWYLFFDENKDLDNGETSSQALAAKTTGNVLIFGAVEWKTKGLESLFARHEIANLHERLQNGNIKSIVHMQKDATKPSQVMATDDADGKLTWKNSFKEGDSNASGTYDVCASDGTECDVPKPNKITQQDRCLHHNRCTPSDLRAPKTLRRLRRILIRNEELLQRHFDAPFDMVQTKKRLKVQTYLPAMTRFLFSRPGQYKAQQRHDPLHRHGHTLLRPRNLRKRQQRVEVLHHQRRQGGGQLR
ncbi:uncharacterized protein J4E88_009860 [Alternaria novae-zelandiae]|uniref:uncharacterized protein n=1 Tax=Alternaria novae-zelandiae TaxID=430562 RepID=UPI0020C46144|nr:uncharacterized protein J4E88_009860 [Alternaria novae-zelandiae]KAI4670767.1 hypothetical protein J4E88_009860 [Alternaria novae-zelandiae]